MVKIQHPQFGEVEAVDIDYESPNEEWRDYELDDGATLKVKTIVNKIFRFEDVHNELGEPVYQISTENMIRAVDIPEDKIGKADAELIGEGGVPRNQNREDDDENQGQEEWLTVLM